MSDEFGEALGEVGRLGRAKDVAGLLAALDDPREEGNLSVRGRAAWELSRLREPSAAEPIARLARDDESTPVRALATALLSKFDPDVVGAAAREATADATATVRQAAAGSLGEWGRREDGPIVVRLLDDADQTVRQNAAWALAEIGDAQWRPAVERLYANATGWRHRRHVRRSLRRLPK